MLTMNEARYDLTHLADKAGLTRRQLRTALGLSNRRYVALEQTGLDDEQADRYAIRLGLFPWQVWPTYDLDGTGWDLDHPAVRRRLPEGVPPRSASSEQP